MADRTATRDVPGSGGVEPAIPANLPVHLRDPVRAYVRKASHLSIDPHRILLCACLLVAAERRPECHGPAGPALPMVPYDSLAALLGLSEGSPPALVAARYRRFRKARQQIHLALEASRQRMKKLVEILKKNDAALPETLRNLVANMCQEAAALDRSIVQLLAATYPGTAAENPLRRRRVKGAHERFNVQQQALIWWWHCLHQVSGSRGKFWDDLYTLARVWRLTDCRDVSSLRRTMVRFTRGTTEIVAPPGWCEKACH